MDNAQHMERTPRTKGSLSGPLSTGRITDAAINKFFDHETDNPTSEKVMAERMEAAMDAAVAAAAAAAKEEEASTAGGAGKDKEADESGGAAAASADAGHDMPMADGAAHVRDADECAEGGQRDEMGEAKIMTPLPTAAVVHSTPGVGEGGGEEVEGTPPADTASSTMPTPLTVPRQRNKGRVHAGEGEEDAGMADEKEAQTKNAPFAAGVRYSKRKQEQQLGEVKEEANEAKEDGGGSRRSPRKRSKGGEWAASPSAKTQTLVVA